ncbi:MAG: hypothetical protein JRD89_10780 [Deltaproteobacteria bacterium]|nr:hypothetical protein [Deltaproteobacteria bacterium]
MKEQFVALDTRHVSTHDAPAQRLLGRCDNAIPPLISQLDGPWSRQCGVAQRQEVRPAYRQGQDRCRQRVKPARRFPGRAHDVLAEFLGAWRP